MRKYLLIVLLVLVGCQPAIPTGSGGDKTKKNKAAEERIARKAAARAERQQALQRKAMKKQANQRRQRNRNDANPWSFQTNRGGSIFSY